MSDNKEIMAIMLKYAAMYKLAQKEDSKQYFLMAKEVSEMYNKMYLRKFNEAITNAKT